MSTLRMLFAPLDIGTLQVKNRIGMAPMTTGYGGEDGQMTSRMLEYYKARAQGGAGLITVESCYVQKRGKGFLGHLAIDDDRYVEGLSQLTETIHSAGARAVIQLIHCGRQTNPALCGRQPVAPSPIPCPVVREMPHALSIPEIEEIQHAFIDGAERAQKAGFDGVEIHAAHGYLLNQFLSPYSNRRKDRFGGDLINRSRLLLDIVSGVKERLGREFPVLCRISAEEFVPGGLTLAETTQVARWLENLGLDAVSVTGGVYESARMVIPSMDAPQGVLTSLSRGIKQAVNIPVFAVCRLYDPEYIDNLLVEGGADLALIGRSLVADPDWPRKVQAGEMERIRPCIYCNQCRNRALRPAMNCAVNYRAGREHEPETPVSSHKNVTVIGGGVAGMEAAIICAQRGHKVVLYESNDTLGGNLLAASAPPHRERLMAIVKFLSAELTRMSVEVKLKTAATLDSIRKKRPDVVILATGSRPAIIDLPGIDQAHVHLATDVLTGRARVGDHTVVIGGGLVGLETADFLRELGKAVTVVEQLPVVGGAPQVEGIFRGYLISRLTAPSQPVLILTSCRVNQIGPDFVTVEQDGVEKRLPGVDSVVIAIGMERHMPIDPEKIEEDIKVFTIGDATEPMTVFEAIHSAARAAYTI